MIYVRWSISILLIFVGFRSLVTPQWHFEKGYWVKTRCRISLIYAVAKDSIGTWGKRPVLVHSLGVGGSYESITNYRKPVVIHNSINWWPSMNAAKLREAGQDHLRIDCPPPLPCGLSLLQQISKQHKLELCKGLTGGQSAKRAFGDFRTAYIVESGL